MSDRCGKLSGSVAWRKPYQDFQDVIYYCLSKLALKIQSIYSTSRCYEVQEPHPQPPHRLRGGG
jgi:hypothetical protein